MSATVEVDANAGHEVLLPEMVPGARVDRASCRRPTPDAIGLATPPREVATMNDDKTIDTALEWLGKAQQLGFYSSNVARLIRAGAEAVRSVLDKDEDRSVERVIRDLDDFHVRLLNKADNINAATAQTYVTRTKRLLSDYRGWLKDPKAYKPTARRGRGPAARSKTDRSEELPFGEEPAPPRSEGQPSAPYRDHTLSLSTGKAYLRIPASISADDVMLLTLVIRSHGPSTPTEPAPG
jgi:hypothetical protein